MDQDRRNGSGRLRFRARLGADEGIGSRHPAATDPIRGRVGQRLVPPERSAITDLIQLIYSSQPFGYDGAMLSGILLDARRCNARDGITGALVCRHDIYLQLLEGPQAAVEAAFARIGRDDRHLGIRRHSSGPVAQRTFGDWAMLHDPATTWIWTPEEIDAGVLDRATPAEIGAVFERLAQKVAVASPG